MTVQETRDKIDSLLKQQLEQRGYSTCTWEWAFTEGDGVDITVNFHDPIPPMTRHFSTSQWASGNYEAEIVVMSVVDGVRMVMPIPPRVQAEKVARALLHGQKRAAEFEMDYRMGTAPTTTTTATPTFTWTGITRI